MAKKELRQVRIESNAAFVPLTRGYEAKIDPADAHLIDCWNWYALVQDKTVYAVREVSLGGRNRRTERMHRTIAGNPEGREVDHINGDGLDNRRENLRPATKSQNGHNAGAKKNSKSGIKGVHWAERDQRWIAKIMVNRKSTNLGSFKRKDQAASAYAAAAAIIAR